MNIRRRSLVAIALLAPLSGCFMWPSTNVQPPDWAPQPPIEGHSYTPGQPSVSPEIVLAQPSLQGSTLAGDGHPGMLDGSGAQAQFKEPEGLAVAADGTVFVAEPYAYRIRKIAPDGRVTTLAGGSHGRDDGQGAGAKFFGPKDLVLDDEGNLLVADFDKLRRITPDGRVTTLSIQAADGPYEPVELMGIARAKDGTLFVSTTSGIDRIQGGTASRFAGADAKGYRDGNGSAAYFNLPRKLALDSQNNLYVADFGNLRIRKVSPTRQVTTVAGNGILGFVDGASTRSRLNFPMGVAVDAQDNVLVADTYNHALRRLTPQGEVTTLAGNNQAGFQDGVAGSVMFHHPTDVAVSPNGQIFVADRLNHRIRRLQ